MIMIKEMKVLEIDNCTYNIGEELTIFWIVNTDSFKKYHEKYHDKDDEDYNWLLLEDTAEMFGDLKGWTENSIIVNMDQDELIEIPISDIESVYS